MFGVGPATRIYLAAGATDMRKSFEGVVRTGAGPAGVRSAERPYVCICECATQPPEAVVLGRQRSVGLWHASGEGRSRWPEAAPGAGKITLTHEELAFLLGGIDLSHTWRRAWYRRGKAEAGIKNKSA